MSVVYNVSNSVMSAKDQIKNLRGVIDEIEIATEQCSNCLYVERKGLNDLMDDYKCCVCNASLCSECTGFADAPYGSNGDEDPKDIIYMCTICQLRHKMIIELYESKKKINTDIKKTQKVLCDLVRERSWVNNSLRSIKKKKVIK